MGVERELAPLLLPRQYYIGLPRGRNPLIPRTPPRNCYVELKSESSSLGVELPGVEKFCSYFTEDRTLGRYLFFNISFVDSAVVVLARGDIAFRADGIRMTARDGERATRWAIYLQPSPGSSSDRLLEVTAFLEDVTGRFERDRRVEGWAHLQPLASGGSIVSILGRIDFKAIRPSIDSGGGEEWPPRDWRGVRFELGRRNVDPPGMSPTESRYARSGAIALSLAAKAQAIYNSHGKLILISDLPVGQKHNAIETQNDRAHTQRPIRVPGTGITVLGGDLIVGSEALKHSERVPDTHLSLEVLHPRNVIEGVLWWQFLVLAVVILALLFLAAIGYWRLVYPMWRMSRAVTELHDEMFDLGSTRHALANRPPAFSIARRFDAWANSLLSLIANWIDRRDLARRKVLPYGDRTDEIGTLAKGFNALLLETRRRAQVETERNKNWELSLRFIKHEVRNPLTVLMNSELTIEERLPLLERIDHYFKALDQITSPETITVTPTDQNLLAFVQEFAVGANRGISGVRFVGESNHVMAAFDAVILSQALENVLMNASEWRYSNTEIRMSLVVGNGKATIFIDNDGPNIDPELLPHVFEPFKTYHPEGKTEGRGLGLYTTRVYVRRMNGSTDIENIDTGVRFQVVLPIAA